jgi:signal transduction histidine kinase
MGLINIRERANQIGASLKITSNPGMGTTIRVITSVDKFISKEILGA